MKRSAVTIACFGEILWDLLPRGLFLGGAPLNVTYHLTRLGVPALPISAVGRDFLGSEALRRMAKWPVDATFLTRHPRLSTGTVRATLDAQGVARYQIAERVAWDHIVVPSALLRRQPSALLVFGSLALREAANRTALGRLVAAWPETLRVLDLNLRAPFDRGPAVEFALSQAQFVKLNDEELGVQTALPVRTIRQLESAARQFAGHHKIRWVCVTAGARGAGLLWEDRWYWQNGRPVRVRDTVGAGDAFLAGFLTARFVHRDSPAKSLARACRLGEFVAGRDGAMPNYQVTPQGKPVG